MQHGTALEALVRWWVLAAAGLALVLVLPSDAFGADPVLTVAGIPTRPANLVGLAIMFAAWITFVVHLASLCGRCHHDAACRVLLAVFVVTGVGALVASAVATVAVLIGLTVPAVLAQVGLAFRADHLNARRPIRPRGRLAASGS